MPTSFTIEAYFPAAPGAVYQAWLEGDSHSRMTGSAATGVPQVGSPITAHDGYISGKNLELEPHWRIVQAWRTTDFPEDAPDSKVEIVLEADGSGCILKLTHSEIPDDQPNYEQGWEDHYFAPMTEYFDE